jgi:hypothetical protein
VDRALRPHGQVMFVRMKPCVHIDGASHPLEQVMSASTELRVCADK